MRADWFRHGQSGGATGLQRGFFTRMRPAWTLTAVHAQQYYHRQLCQRIINTVSFVNCTWIDLAPRIVQTIEPHTRMVAASI